MRKYIHFIGIAGHAMAPIAKMFQDMGWDVTGSDQKAVFPPITTYLEENGLPFIRGYAKENISRKPDLVIVGRSALLVDKENPEVMTAKEMGCQILSYPEVLRDYLVKDNSIVIAGTYGKTTTTALVTWILEQANLSPSYLIGGISLNFTDGVRNTDSSYSVIEGDEPPAMYETDPPKFMFYKPKFVLLTAAKWDHPEIFKKEIDYVSAFTNFICLIPHNGLLVACKDGANVQKISKFAKCPVIWYSANKGSGDFWLENISYLSEATRFEIVCNRERILLQTTLLGQHNLQNIVGGVALCRNLGIGISIIENAVKTFRGIRSRLEKLGVFGAVTVFKDFAQHPARVKESLAALRIRYRKEKIFCIFDPHSSALQQQESLGWYNGSFDSADQVIITKVTFPKDVKSKDWVTGPEIVKAISQSQPKVLYEPIEDKVIDYLSTRSKFGDVIVFMSSGGQRSSRMVEALRMRLLQRGLNGK